MKAKDTLLLNNTIPQNPNLARRAWFWHVSSHIHSHMYCDDQGQDHDPLIKFNLK